MHTRRRSLLQLGIAASVAGLAALTLAWLAFRLSAGLDAPLRLVCVAGGALLGAIPALAVRYVADPGATRWTQAAPVRERGHPTHVPAARLRTVPNAGMLVAPGAAPTGPAGRRAGAPAQRPQ
jgi:hypothetical protein